MALDQIDVITGKVFQQKFEGQRTAVDLEAIMAEGDDEGRPLTAEHAGATVLNERYAKNIYYQAGRAELEAEYERMHWEALATDPSAVRHVVLDEEVIEAEGRIGKLAGELMGQLSGGGRNAFLRTESGLENWQPMDASGEFIGDYDDLGNFIPAYGVKQINDATSVYNPWSGVEDFLPANEHLISEDGADGSVTGAVPVTGEGPVTASDDADVRVDMQNAFYAALRVAGMEKALIDKLWDWAELELVNDPSFNAERALLGMYDSEAFRTRFRAIADMTDAGYGRRDMPTPGEYIAFEKDVANELKRVGVVEQGASFDNLITSLYTNSVGLGEVTDRLNTAQRVMYQMPPAVRDKLTDWFGDEYGTSITMKTFLDPTDDWSAVQDDISTAQTGGWGQMVAGLNAGWDENLAKQVSDLGLSQAEQWNRFARLKEQERLFTETLDETLDLDYATEGVRAESDLEAEEEGGLSGYELSDLITKRGQKRSARFSGGGGALMSGTTTGFGAANA